jgi:N-acetylmuramoyl-L-alanine amidase
MREIKYIVIHCTAGPQNQPTSEIKAYWKNVNGWTSPGYHFEINADGTIEELQPIEKIANGVAGYNKNAIHISYKGGIDNNGKPVDNRTEAQIQSQISLIKKYKAQFPNAVVLGHRDFSRDQNGNGIVDRWEWIKSCPAFDVRNWLIEIELERITKPSKIIYKLNAPLIKDTNVLRIQQALIDKGYKVKLDGYFGAETDVAVRRFQKQITGLTVDGIVGKETAAHLGVKLI